VFTGVNPNQAEAQGFFGKFVLTASMASGYPHGAWFLLAGLGCLLVLVCSTTAWFVAAWLNPSEFLPSGPGADEDLFTGVVLGAGFGLLSLASLILTLIGLDEMRLTYPEVGHRITRQIGPVLVRPWWVVLLFMTIVVASIVAEMQAAYTAAASLVGRSAVLAVVTFLMIVSEEALRPLVPRTEGRLVFAAGVAAIFGGLLLTGSGIVGFLLGRGSSQFLPWASVPSGILGTFALVVLVRAAWEVASRWERNPTSPWMASG
jgi:hypothetical protein